MSKEYPYKCVRCGFCCLNCACPVGQTVFKIKKEDKCPGLSFDNNGTASCVLTKSEALKPILGIDFGCDTLSKAIIQGIALPFDSLPEPLKKLIVKLQVENKLTVLTKEEAKELYGEKYSCRI